MLRQSPAPCFPQAPDCGALYLLITRTACIRLWGSRCCPTRADSATPPCGAKMGCHPAAIAQCWGSSSVRAKWENASSVRVDLALSSEPGERGPEASLQVHRRPIQDPEPLPLPTKPHFKPFFLLEGFGGVDSGVFALLIFLLSLTTNPGVPLTLIIALRS